MTEPSEWAMEKARKVFKQLWVTDHGCDDVSEQRQTQDVFAIARALDEAKALNTEKETMLLNQAKTIKEMQASHEGREALAWMQMHMPYCYCKAVRAMIQVGEIK